MLDLLLGEIIMEAFVGTILLWPSHRCPAGWTFCNGQSLPIREYQALYALIGNIYGGDGRTVFNLPDLRGYVPVGNSLARDFTQMGVKTVGPNSNIPYGTTEPVTTLKLPEHNHAVSAPSGFETAATTIQVAIPADSKVATTDIPSNSVSLAVAKSDSGDMVSIYGNGNATDSTTLKPFTVNIPSLPVSAPSFSTASTGTPNPTLSVGVPKLITLNFIIALEGIFPTFY